MNLIKTSLLNSIAVIVRMTTLLGLNKVLAIYVGPVGYAALGQFQNAVQMTTSLAGASINTGVVKYTAEYRDSEKLQRSIWGTAGAIVCVGSLTAASIILIFKQRLSLLFFNTEEFSSVLYWLAGTLTLLSLNSLLLAILNGKKEIKRYVIANIVGSLFSLCVTGAMAVHFGLYGVLVALCIHQSLSFLITLWLCWNTSWFHWYYLIGSFDRIIAKNLSKFVLMAITSAICIPAVHILVRSHLGDKFGWETAGYWEAMWRLSAAYLLFVTTTLGVYYLPRLSEIKGAQELRAEVLYGYKIILPAAAFMSLTVYLLRDVVINVLFTSEFQAMRELFSWQLFGDSVKIATWILGYILTARAFVKIFIFVELCYSAIFYILVLAFCDFFGFVGVAMAHAAAYILQLILIYIILRKKMVI